MQKRSILTKILILVLLALVIPSAFGQVACFPPSCLDSCPIGTYDCTNAWMMSSMDNFYTYMALWWNGYTPLVCCMA